MVQNESVLSFSGVTDNETRLAKELHNKFNEFSALRQGRERTWEETMRYVFATDTKDTAVGKQRWQNSTTIPKLCNIRDVLHASCFSALFANPNWVDWEGDTVDDIKEEKRQKIKSYVKTKARLMNLENEVSLLLADWIDYGVCFAITEYVNLSTKMDGTEEEIVEYRGAKTKRISPYDIVFDPTAKSFEKSPKILKSIMSLGDLAQLAQQEEYYAKVYEVAVANRKDYQTSLSVPNAAKELAKKNAGFNILGIGDYNTYFSGDLVEVLTYYGSWYDRDSYVLHNNQVITVVDGQNIVKRETNENWTGQAAIRMCGWRIKQDSLYAQGALEGIVGLQHRMDSLENAKADATNFLLQPPMKKKGNTVLDFDWAPNIQIDCGDSGDLEVLQIGAPVIQADSQIGMYLDLMEEMAGTPKQVMGVRTPGEKTAHEVQLLDNAAARQYQQKVQYFEAQFLEPILNDILEIGRRHLDSTESIKAESDIYAGTVEFLQVTKEDLAGRGAMRALGARYFAHKANQLQDLNSLVSGAAFRDPLINAHFSTIRIAKTMENLLSFNKYGLVEQNVRVGEELEYSKQKEEAQAQLQMLAETPTMEEDMFAELGGMNV